MNAQCNSLSVHFQVLIAGTVLFLAAFFWGTTPQHSPSGQIVNQEFSTYFGLSAIAVYLAFVAIVVGHALLETKFGHKGLGAAVSRNQKMDGKEAKTSWAKT